LPTCSALKKLLFADDTKLLAKGKNICELVSFVNAEFHKIVSFFRAHKLAFHPDKTKFMTFSNSTECKDADIQIFINCNNPNELPNPDLIKKIERVTAKSKTPAIKFLGVYFDPNLDFKYHIGTISNKLSFPKLWNEFDNFGLKINPNKISFNVGLKKMFFDSLADNYVCNRLLCPHCHLP
jgi:hypothetical protein